MPTRKRPPGTLVLLVRHGQTPTTGRVLPGRAPGLHLSAAGARQAENAAARLSGLPLAALYTSPLERAQETAAPTAAATGLVPVVEPDLFECDFGEWTGESLATLARRKEWRALMTSPSTFRFPGGESLAELEARMVSLLDRLRGAHPDGVVACFTHADPIRAALTYAVGAPLDAFHRVNVGTGSVSVVRFPHDAPPLVLGVNSLHGPLDDLVPSTGSAV
ncbi:MAG: histidine phosphatase family protein [Propionicimonas sp.]|uniref:histidine phosphatase family protein n=1 Tax=Propionicimonas sp. TaxID=1955623 RepID=UPI003D12E0FC